jgi:CubicO group peptidase (beta-lactamase class C family)
LMQELILQPLHMVHSTFQQPIPEKLRPLIAMPYDKDGKAIEGGPHTYPEMAVAGLWTTPSDLALFALAIQDALAGKPGAIVSPSTAREMLQPVLVGFYALAFAIAGNGPNRYFFHPGWNPGYLSFFFAYEKGDGVVLMSNEDHSKALMLEVIHALAKQYGWTEFPTDSTFSNPWIVGLICASIVLVTYLLFRVIRRRKGRNERPVKLHL